MACMIAVFRLRVDWAIANALLAANMTWYAALLCQRSQQLSKPDYQTRDAEPRIERTDALC
jgi:hypothetical protein